jgi:hypothetical protein
MRLVLVSADFNDQISDARRFLALSGAWSSTSFLNGR